MNQKKRVNPMAVALLILLVWFGIDFYKNISTVNDVTYYELQQLFEQEKVKEFSVADTRLTAKLQDGSTASCDLYHFDLFYEDMHELVEEQAAAGIITSYDYWADHSTNWLELLLPCGVLLVGFFLMMGLTNRMGGAQNDRMAKFGEARAQEGQKSKKTFRDVAGADEEKEELQEIVEFLRDPEKYLNLGAHIPKGVLLVGPPGTTYIINGVEGNTEMGQKITPVSVSGSDSWKSDATYSYEKVFDGNTSTYFDGLGNGWVQMDLGEKYEISSVGYCPRSGYEYRCADGEFMVSDDGTNWKTVYTIKGRPSFGMHYAKISGNVSGRYVRYQVPEGKPSNGYNSDNTYCCNMAEIEVYGNSSKLSGLNKIQIASDSVTGSDSWNQSQNTADKVFDGNNKTYFDGVGNGWVQADLGSVHTIDAIGYCPRSGYEYRCPDAMFMTSVDGINWTKLHTISGVPQFNMNYIFPSEPVRARYVRYQVPEGAPTNSYNKDNVYCCNMAEIEIYGNESNISGDVNSDGKFDIADLVMLNRYILGNGTLNDYISADVCNDSVIDAYDLTAMRKLFS